MNTFEFADELESWKDDISTNIVVEAAEKLRNLQVTLNVVSEDLGKALVEIMRLQDENADLKAKFAAGDKT